MSRRGVDYSVFQGRVKLRALVNSVMNSWVPHDAGYVWSSCRAHSFSSLSYDRSIHSSKASSPHSEIYCFLFQFPFKNCKFLKKDPISWSQVHHICLLNKNCDRHIPYDPHTRVFISLSSINRLVVVMNMDFVHCEEGTKLLYII
jgi:hypothetical protein